jgi:histidinol dehydrogenase
VRPPPIIESRDRNALAELYAPGWTPNEDVVASVAKILRDVRSRGDDALCDYARRFDDPDFRLERLRVTLPSLEEARTLVPSEVAAGLELARERVLAFHARQRVPDIEYDEPDGSRYAILVRPLASVGAYVPGGTASLPSSAIMTTVPAKLAGIGRVVVVTPPARSGPGLGVNPAILFACVLCGVDELYAVGGAQAIGALAYGTSRIARVDKIVGPGSVWVTEAKRQVFGVVGIDGLAGPSEVLVVADESSRPELVAGEMLAQAEHDRYARVATVSTSRDVLARVSDVLVASAETERNDIVRQVFDERAWLIHARDEEEIVDIIDRFAPEHLSIQTRDPMQLVPRVRHAGAIFVGASTPVAAGDYIAGTNHVLPTAGAARFGSGLRLGDFMRTMSLVEYSDARMQHDADVLASLAEFEGLPAHAQSARMRKR